MSGPTFINTPYAHMGYVGSLQLSGLPNSVPPVTIRVTSCDIHASQDITYPEVIDGRIDTTIYQIAPMIVGGNIAFPLVHEDAILGCSTPPGGGTIANPIASTLWQIAAQRDSYGRMRNTFNSDIRYADNTAFTYQGCMMNTFGFSINQGESVNVTSEIYGGVLPLSSYTNNGGVRSPYGGTDNVTFLSPARVVTWNDARIALFSNSSSSVFGNNEIREFACTLNNGLERIYTMNGALGPQDIAPKKRTIEGTLKIMGLDTTLDSIAYTNSQNYTSSAAIAFGYCLGANGSGSVPYWATAFVGVIFKLEEMALSTGLFETSTTWRALGDCNFNYLATFLGASTPMVNPGTSGGAYGASTADGFPAF